MTALSQMGAGGPVLVVLGLLSLLSLTIIVMKILQLMPVLSGAEGRVKALSLWASGDRAGAAAHVAQGKAPADRVLHFAMDTLSAGKPRNMSALLSVVAHRGTEELTRMTSKIRLLELIAMIGPLLGLLGTVLGMIQSFQELEMAQGSANASILAGGIWEALLTTAAGLLVAIPAAVGAGLLSVRAERAAQSIEGAIGELMLLEDSADAA